jgi:tetratricopeptide (TPR) repeat protein
MPSDGPGGDDASREERLAHEAAELMRQGRYHDAVNRYRQLATLQPGDPWAGLGHASALECAGDISGAEQILEQTAASHGRNAHVQRFRRMFFERREDYHRARSSTDALRGTSLLDDEPADGLADLYFNQGRYLEARTELERLLRDEEIGSEPQAGIRARLGACLRQMGELEAARDQLLASVTLAGEQPWSLAELAETERALGNATEAKRHYLGALALNPDDHWCRGHLAQLEYEQGDAPAAIVLYRQILESQPKTVWALVELAQVTAGSDHEAAEKLCHEALEIDPTYPWASMQLGHLARGRGELEAARTHYARALETAPGTPWILHELADTCRQLGRHEEALAHLGHARNASPYDATTYGYLADVLRHANRSDEAIAHLAKAVELDGDYAWAWRELAELRALAGQHAAADEALAEVRRLDADDAGVDGLAAFLLRCRGAVEAALPLLRSALTKRPDYPWAWRELVEALLHLGRTEDAVQAAEQAFAALEHHGYLRVLHARALRRLGRTSEALASLETALRAEPESALLWATRAELELDGDPAAALRSARKAVKLDASPETRLALAQALLANQRHGEAQGLIGELTSQHPQLPAVWDLAAELAERQGDRSAALAAATRGLQRHSEDPRLLLRCARLEADAGQGAGLARLEAVLDDPAAVLNWREAALLTARHGRADAAYRAVARHRQALRHLAQGEAESLELLLECQFALDDHDAAWRSFQRLHSLRGQSVQVLLLGAAVAERRHDHAAARELLDRLADSQPGLFDPATPEGMVLRRQRARAMARCGDRAGADALLEPIGAAPADPVTALDTAQMHDRRGLDPAGTLILLDSALERSLREGNHDGARILVQEGALRRYRRHGAGQAIAWLREQGEALPPAGRQLLAQLLLSDDLPAEALAVAATLPGPAPACLVARCHLARGDFTAAAGAAAAVLDDPGASDLHEEAATILGQAQAFRHDFSAAAATMADPRLPAQPSAERLLLGALIRLEAHGCDAALAWLGRGAGQGIDQPLGRVLAAAWPDTWTSSHGLPAAVELDDLRAVPPFPRAVGRLAAALASNGHGAHAAQLAEAVAGAVLHQQAASGRELLLLACRLYRRAGHGGAARRCARGAGAWGAWLRAWWPR